MTKSKDSDFDGIDPSGIDGENEHGHDCVEDVDLDELEATQDVELPPARGGVEQPALPQS